MASMITVQMQGLVAGDENGPVSVANPPDKTTLQKGFRREKKTVSNEPFTVKTVGLGRQTYIWTSFIWALDRKFAGRKHLLAPIRRHIRCSSRWTMSPNFGKTTHLEIQGKTGITADRYISRTISIASALKKQFSGSGDIWPRELWLFWAYTIGMASLSATPRWKQLVCRQIPAGAEGGFIGLWQAAGGCLRLSLVSGGDRWRRSADQYAHEPEINR